MCFFRNEIFYNCFIIFWTSHEKLKKYFAVKATLFVRKVTISSINSKKQVYSETKLGANDNKEKPTI